MDKTIIGYLKYGKGKDYDAKKYWDDRLSTHGSSLKGSGVEGFSEKENKKMYLEFSKVLMYLFKKQEIDFNDVNVLEIGCGSGYWTQFLYDLGVKKYVGVDITDVLFTDLKKRFPNFNFIKKDITMEKINGKFNLILMIGLICHITTVAKFSFTMENIKNCLSKDGTCIISNILDKSKIRLFYMQYWSLEDVERRFIGYEFSKPVHFRDTCILAIRKSHLLNLKELNPQTQDFMKIP